MIEENYLYRAKPNVVVRRPQGVKPLAVRRPEGVNFGNFRKGFKILAVVSSLDFLLTFCVKTIRQSGSLIPLKKT